MSILKKAYEISIWDDQWDEETEAYIEKKVLTIGSDKMVSQNKVFSPIFSHNVNGSKKLTFKAYGEYIDNLSGEKIKNPFVKELFNERKVKLKYKNKWYDFIIKNV
jgi:hypothetical protein